MSYTVEKLEKSQVKISFTIDADTFGKATEKAYQKSKGKFAIGGFRKGHAPRKVIEGLYGSEVFFEDAMDIVINDAYYEALDKESDLNIVARPELKNMDKTKDGGVTFELVATVKPEVKLGDYKNLDIKKEVQEVSEEQVKAEIELARDKQARLVEVDKAAENGDTVTFDFSGSVDGEKFDGGTAENFDLVLGSGNFIPGFEEQLVGVKAGEEKNVNVKFPEDYHAENLKGKDSVFECKIHAIKSKELPEFDDEFVKEISEFDTVADFTADTEKRLKEEAVANADKKFENELIEKIVNNAEIELPEAMVTQEVEDMIKDFEYRLQFQGMQLAQYLEYVHMSMEDLKKQYTEQAKITAKTRLVMEAIILAENIELKDEDMDAKFQELAEKAGKSVEDFKKEMKREQIDYLVNQIVSDKLMATLKELNLSK